MTIIECNEVGLPRTEGATVLGRLPSAVIGHVRLTPSIVCPEQCKGTHMVITPAEIGIPIINKVGVVISVVRPEK